MLHDHLFLFSEKKIYFLNLHFLSDKYNRLCFSRLNPNLILIRLTKKRKTLFFLLFFIIKIFPNKEKNNDSY